MGYLMIKCPKTGISIPTHIEISRARFKRTPVFFASTYCPVCNAEHEWFAQEAWLDGPDRQGTLNLNGHARL